MIRRDTVVVCDRCPATAQTALEGEDARELAREDGFQVIDGEDLCRACAARRPLTTPEKAGFDLPGHGDNA